MIFRDGGLLETETEHQLELSVLFLIERFLRMCFVDFAFDLFLAGGVLWPPARIHLSITFFSKLQSRPTRFAGILPAAACLHIVIS